MLFSGLIGGYIVLRLARGEAWPPAGAPDIGVQWPLSSLNLVMIANTIVLVGSSFLFHNAESAIKKKGKSGLFWLFATIVAGSIFFPCRRGSGITFTMKGFGSTSMASMVPAFS